MSLLSTFITTNLLKLVEHEFSSNEAAIQEVVISEVQQFIADAVAWVESKIHKDSPQISTDESAQ